MINCGDAVWNTQNDVEFLADDRELIEKVSVCVLYVY